MLLVNFRRLFLLLLISVADHVMSYAHQVSWCFIVVDHMMSWRLTDDVVIFLIMMSKAHQQKNRQLITITTSSTHQHIIITISSGKTSSSGISNLINPSRL